MNFKDWMFLFENIESRVPQISYQQAQERNLFGPVYHGTSEENRSSIENKGFQVFYGGARQGEISHGYELRGYGAINVPPPVHHLGYGIYFTTVKDIAKSYNYGTTKGLKQYYLDVPKLQIINFGSPNTMMKWWQKNGYDMDSSFNEEKRILATKNLTDVLRSKYDAVYFKGRGLKRLLDGDQICVYDPHKIYELNTSLAQEDEVSPGDRFIIKGTNIVVKIIKQSFRSGDYLDVLFVDPENKLKELYGEEIWNDAITTMPDLLDTLKRNFKSNDDDYVKDAYIDRRISILKNKFPKAWLGRKLKKGERFKPI